MILLDTNIVSEFMGTRPDQRVEAWLKKLRPSDLYLTSITVAEILIGIANRPISRRQRILMEDFEMFERTVIGPRVLGFDRVHAAPMAEIVRTRRASGLSVDFVDCQIAAIAFVSGAVLATRNIKDFEGVGLNLINPFTFAG